MVARMRQSSARAKPALGKRIRLALVICAALYAVACAGCAAWQRRLIYFPPVFTAAQVDELARAAKLERWRNAAGQAVGMKRLSPRQPAEGRVLLAYGNGSCATGCARYADVIQKAAALDVYILEFGRRLYEGYAGPKRIWEFPEADHWTVTQRTPGDWKEVVDFWHGRSN